MNHVSRIITSTGVKYYYADDSCEFIRDGYVPKVIMARLANKCKTASDLTTFFDSLISLARKDHLPTAYYQKSKQFYLHRALSRAVNPVQNPRQTA